MRVALVVGYDFPAPTETQIASKLAGLVDRGVDAHVVCWESSPQLWRAHPYLAGRPDLRARVHPTWTASLARKLLRLARFGLIAARRPAPMLRYLRAGWSGSPIALIKRTFRDYPLLRLRPDVVHFERGEAARARMYLKRALDCSVTVSFRGIDLNAVGVDDPGFYDEVWRDADAVHTLGEDLWRRALSRGCPADMPRALIAPALDPDEFSPGPRSTPAVGAAHRPLRLLGVARLHWKKGFEHGLAAVRLLLDRGLAVEYRIAGEGPYRDAVAACLRDLQLEEDVVLLGWRPHEQVREEMRWADVLLHPATSEGFCNAVIEAQAMGLPVVCSDADGLAENVAAGASGFVVPRRDPEALADRLELLARDPALRRRMGQAGRRRVRSQFRRDRQIEALVRFYDDVAARRAAGSRGGG